MPSTYFTTELHSQPLELIDSVFPSLEIHYQGIYILILLKFLVGLFFLFWHFINYESVDFTYSMFILLTFNAFQF